jgi:hypothetical protein
MQNRVTRSIFWNALLWVYSYCTVSYTEKETNASSEDVNLQQIYLPGLCEQNPYGFVFLIAGAMRFINTRGNLLRGMGTFGARPWRVAPSFSTQWAGRNTVKSGYCTRESCSWFVDESITVKMMKWLIHIGLWVRDVLGWNDETMNRFQDIACSAALHAASPLHATSLLHAAVSIVYGRIYRKTQMCCGYKLYNKDCCPNIFIDDKHIAAL